MGRILDIRVIAQTFNEDEVARAWPGLCSLVWPGWMASFNVRERWIDKIAALNPEPSLVEKALGQCRHGVLELAQSLEDLAAFGRLPEHVTGGLRFSIHLASRASAGLAAALADRDTKTAGRMSAELEDALDQAEKALEKIGAT